MPEICVSELGVQIARLDLDPEVDVTFADLNHVNAHTQLADQRLWPGSLNVEFGGVFDEGLGFEAARTRREANYPNDAKGLE
jgi:hypothetical protein